jgi:glutamine cyclotransferase
MRSAAMALAALSILALGPVADARAPRHRRVPSAVSTAAIVRPQLVQCDALGRFPHDPTAFTEGLIVEGDTLHESVGLEGQSDIRRINLPTGTVEARSTIPPQQFGEGLTRWRDQLISLTWTDGIAHIWDAASLRPVTTARYPGQGWGLTTVGPHLAMSDGSADIVFRDPATLVERRRIRVTSAGRLVREINELEWVDGRILANVWHTPYIVAIDPATGTVTHLIDCSNLVQEVGLDNPEAVLNGIAFDPVRRRLFVTGKLWPTLFEIRVPDWR